HELIPSRNRSANAEVARTTQGQTTGEVTARQAGRNAGFARNPSIFNLIFNVLARQVGSPCLETSDDSLAEQWWQNDIHCVRLSYCSAPIVLPNLSFPFAN